MILNPNALIQVAILAAGIYFVLGFLRSARGSGLVRGIAVALLFGAVGLWWLARLLELRELEHIIQGMAGYVVVVLAIIFQPELRRGISQLGFTQLVGKLMHPQRTETVSEVAQAVRAMAKRRQGALIAFERDTPLDDYVQSGVRIDALVTRLLIDSIFQPGGALHDGAIVIKRERVAAALCLFPLTENIEIAKSTGTRHRAALGLTDETDAVTVAVSEETGEISICAEGRMVRGIPAKELEGLLRESLASIEEREAEQEPHQPPTLSQRARRALQHFATHEVQRKLAALLLALGAFLVAHNDLTVEEPLTFQVRSDDSARPGPLRAGQILVRLPGPGFQIVAPTRDQDLRMVATGTRARTEGLGAALAGVLTLAGDTPTGGIDFPLDEVVWTRLDGSGGGPVRVSFQDDRPPRLIVGRVATRTITLVAAHLSIDTRLLDARYAARPERLTFDPSSVVITGPLQRIDALDGPELPFALEPLVLGPLDTKDVYARVGLAPELASAGFAFEHGGFVTVHLPIDPSLRDLASIEREIAVVDLSPDAAGGTPWVLPPHARTARFRIRTAGILPADSEGTGDPERQNRQKISASVRRFVEENLVAFVDVAELDEAAGRSVPVRYVLRNEWREALAAEQIPFDERASLSVALESSARVLLVDRDAAESSPPVGED